MSLWSPGSQSRTQSKDYLSPDWQCRFFPLTSPKIPRSSWSSYTMEGKSAALSHSAAGLLPAEPPCASDVVPRKLACCPCWMLSSLNAERLTLSYNNGFGFHNENECFSYKKLYECWRKILLLVLIASLLFSFLWLLLIRSKFTHRMRSHCPKMKYSGMEIKRNNIRYQL